MRKYFTYFYFKYTAWRAVTTQIEDGKPVQRLIISKTPADFSQKLKTYHKNSTNQFAHQDGSALF